MKYGKIRIEDGHLAFTKHMMINSLPCKDVIWAYIHREGIPGRTGRQLAANSLVIFTRRKKQYKFEMSEKEAQDCLLLLKILNPELAVGLPKGERLPLQSLPNTRDLGALQTEDGRRILPRKLFRSGELYHVSMADQMALKEEYRLKTVIDFRARFEREQKPDTLLPGVGYYHIPILDEETAGITKEASLQELLCAAPNDAKSFIKKHYENMIRDQYSVKQYARFIDILLRHEEGAILWHGSLGKDKTGVGTALLLCVLGVSEESIREDFLRSNLYLEEELQYMRYYMETREEFPEQVIENMDILYTVYPQYIDRVFEVIKEDYGSIERFIRKALYLTPKTVENLREKYLI